MAVSVLWPFLTVQWVGLQCVIVAFPGHAHLFFELLSFKEINYMVLHHQFNQFVKPVTSLLK